MENGAQNRYTVQQTSIAALACAGIATGAYISIPMGPVPFSLQTLFVLLAGLLLRPQWAASAIGAYLLLGSIGLPVFSAGSGGIGHLLGPTGGYLWAFLPAVVAASFIAGRESRRPAPRRLRMRPFRQLMASITATLIIYAGGVFQLAAMADLTTGEAIAAGMLPFLIGDAVKIVAALAASNLLLPLMHRRES